MTNVNAYIAIEEAIAIPGLAERRPSGYFGTNVLVTTSGVLSPAALEPPA